MIVKEKNYKYSIDIGRPTFYTNEHRDFYKKIFHFIENSIIPMEVNGVYYRVRDLLYSESGYGGGGFAFCFFFETKDDRKKFVSEMKSLGFEISDTRNFHFYQSQEKIMYLSFTEKYSVHVDEFIKTNQNIKTKPLIGNDYFNNPMNTGYQIAEGTMKELHLLKDYLDEKFLEFE